MKNTNNKFSSTNGRFVSLTIENSKTPRKTVSAKILSESNNYLSFATFNNGQKVEQKVSKNSIVKVG